MSEGSAPHAQDHSLDAWVHGADDIKSALDALRAAFSKRRLQPHPLTHPDDHEDEDKKPDDKDKKPEGKDRKPDDKDKKPESKKPEEKKPVKKNSFSKPGMKFSIGPDGFKPHSK